MRASPIHCGGPPSLRRAAQALAESVIRQVQAHVAHQAGLPLDVVWDTGCRDPKQPVTRAADARAVTLCIVIRQLHVDREHAGAILGYDGRHSTRGSRLPPCEIHGI